MKIVFRRRRDRHVARLGIFLIVVALIGGMIGCVGIEYGLSITSTTGGSVTLPGEGTFGFDEGTVVNLAAEADAGYRFVNWTGDVASIANVNAASTTVTVDGSYFITANFEVTTPVRHSLTISSTAGGSVTVPGEGIYGCDPGTVVDLVAEAQDGYRFVNWAGNVGTVGNVSAASTTITMNGSYSITATFEKKPMGYA